MKLRQLTQVLVSALGIVFVSESAFAQFPGDVYFESPASVVSQGDSVDLEVLFFSGTDVSGVVAFDVVYDPARLELELTTSPGTTAADTLFVFPEAGRARVVVVNDDSLDQPFGVSGVATLRVRPLVPAGQTVSIALESKGAVTAPGVPFADSNGFGAQVSVVSPATTVAAFVKPDRDGRHMLFDRRELVSLAPWCVPHPETGDPIPVRRVGGTFEWIAPLAKGNVAWIPYCRTVVTIDATAPTD